MPRRFRLPGPLGSLGFTHPQTDINCRGVFDSDFGSPATQLVRVALPRGMDLFVRQSGGRDPRPPFVRLSAEQSARICEVTNERRTQEKKPPTKAVSFEGQFVFGPQFTYHLPITVPKDSAEFDGVVQLNGVLKIHTDDEGGWEFSASLQGSGNWFVLNPFRDNPEAKNIDRARLAGQAQLQLQAAYAFKSFKVGGRDLQISIIVPAAGAVTFQYDPVQKTAKPSFSRQLSAGVSFEYSLSDHFSVIAQITAGGTGPFSLPVFQTIELPTIMIGGEAKF